MCILTFLEGGCKYHSRELHGAGWNFTYSCCGKSSNSYDSAKLLAGCTKGKHCSKHHTDYVYSTYFFYMIEQVHVCYIVFIGRNECKALWRERNISTEKFRDPAGTRTWDLPITSQMLLPQSYCTHRRGAEASLLIAAQARGP